MRALYYSPESFAINKEDEEFYSKQELKYLKLVQNYLLLIGVKDLIDLKRPAYRYRNKLKEKYKNAFIYNFSPKILDGIEAGKINFRVIDYSEYSREKTYDNHEYKGLLVDENEKFKFFVEFTKSEIKEYKDIKDIYTLDKKDDDKINVIYFKILERF